MNPIFKSIDLSLLLIFFNLACTYDHYSYQELKGDAYRLSGDLKVGNPFDGSLDQRGITAHTQKDSAFGHDHTLNDHTLIDQSLVDQMMPPLLPWILIEKGSFEMGPTIGDQLNEYPDEFPIHSVMITVDFWITQSEITVSQYRQCVQAGVCTLPLSLDGCNWDQEGKDLHPINCVNWLQARTFAHWVGGELPSEAQWEYAGRSRGLDVIFPWGNDAPDCDKLNYDAPCYGQTTEVCSLAAGQTAQGLCDMAGNVWEFMLDQYHESYDGAPSNENPWCMRIGCDLFEDTLVSIRGGSWGNPYYHGIRVTHRNSSMAFNPEFPNNAGFRVIKY
jgi:sulfatase modifying factor 1